jgi:biofilm PGA synthesis N-glycosyltransferase PgaC
MSDPTQTLCVAVFAFAGALMFYALFGYPLLLDWLARRSDNPVHKDDKLRSVSFVIAVYNGEKFLERKLRTIFAQNYPRELMEILVISDGSTDRTDEIARSFAAEGVKFLRVLRGGKAAALNAGVPLVSGEILVLNDVRQTLDPNCVTLSPASEIRRSGPSAQRRSSCRVKRTRKPRPVSTGATSPGSGKD